MTGFCHGAPLYVGLTRSASRRDTLDRMAKTRDELEAELQLLDEAMPAVIDECTVDGDLDEAAFWPAFAGMADTILDAASSDDYDWVNQRTDAILKKHRIETGWPESP